MAQGLSASTIRHKKVLMFEPSFLIVSLLKVCSLVNRGLSWKTIATRCKTEFFMNLSPGRDRISAGRNLAMDYLFPFRELNIPSQPIAKIDSHDAFGRKKNGTEKLPYRH